MSQSENRSEKNSKDLNNSCGSTSTPLSSLLIPNSSNLSFCYRIVTQDNAIIRLEWSSILADIFMCWEPKSELERNAEQQLLEYFAGTRQTFDLPLRPTGTDFQKRVWEELLKIPYGQTATYGEIAQRICSPHAARAVGQACNANPIPVFIPCHRVVGTNGRLTGFALGIEVKKKLLELERG